MTEKRILVIEDEFLVALEIETTLENAGFGKIEQAASEPEALARIAEGGWDVVVADANLQGKQIGRIASALMSGGVPFVIVSGYGREHLPAEVAHIPLLEKPFNRPLLVKTVTNLCQYRP